MFIHINKLSSPIRVSSEKGQKIKDMWLDVNVSRATVIDLEEWAGAIREIKSITKEENLKTPDLDTSFPTTEEKIKIQETLSRIKKELSEKLGWNTPNKE